MAASRPKSDVRVLNSVRCNQPFEEMTSASLDQIDESQVARV